MKTIVILALSTLVAWFPGSLAAQSIRPDLNGRVLTESGSPLNGASVFIYTAGPKIGVGDLSIRPGYEVGRVETNLEDFVILLEPGEFGPNHFKDRSQPKHKPLRGASAR